MKKISVTDILTDLENGYARKVSSNNYNEEIGSIEEKYELTASEVDVLFKHPKLKGKKTKSPKEISFEIIDDLEDTTSENIEEIIEEAKEESNPVSMEAPVVEQVDPDDSGLDELV